MKRAQPKRQPVRVLPSRSSKSAVLRLSPVAWRRTWALLGWSVSIVAVVWGMGHMQSFARALQADVPCELEWADLPAWLAGPSGERALQEIAEAADLSADSDIRDPGLCRRVSEGLARSPWVAEVKRITKQSNGVVRVQATYREPFAFVQAGGIAYLVDKAGVRLPNRCVVDFVQDRFWNNWLRITGASGPVTNEGEDWTGEDLAAGLRLVRFLQEATARGEVPFRSSLRAIDVANFGRRESHYEGELRIRTIHPRSHINWGLPPGEEYDIESSASRKLEMLRALYAERGQLPEVVLDVRGSDGIRIQRPDGG